MPSGDSGAEGTEEELQPLKSDMASWTGTAQWRGFPISACKYTPGNGSGMHSEYQVANSKQVVDPASCARPFWNAGAQLTGRRSLAGHWAAPWALCLFGLVRLPVSLLVRYKWADDVLVC